MILKKCSGCGRDLAVKDLHYIGKMQGTPNAKKAFMREPFPLFNCKHCNSTLVVPGLEIPKNRQTFPFRDM